MRIEKYKLTEHARSKIKRRGLSEKLIRRVLASPEQRFEVRDGRDVLQSRIRMKSRTYLVRVFVDIDHQPPEVVTAYRTSNIDKYWRHES